MIAQCVLEEYMETEGLGDVHMRSSAKEMNGGTEGRQVAVPMRECENKPTHG